MVCADSSLVGNCLVVAGPEKVADLEQQWLKSQRTNNVELVEPLLADGFTNTSSDGKVTNRAEAIAEAKATK